MEFCHLELELSNKGHEVTAVALNTVITTHWLIVYVIMAATPVDEYHVDDVELQIRPTFLLYQRKVMAY